MRLTTEDGLVDVPYETATLTYVREPATNTCYIKLNEKYILCSLPYLPWEAGKKYYQEVLYFLKENKNYELSHNSEKTISFKEWSAEKIASRNHFINSWGTILKEKRR